MTSADELRLRIQQWIIDANPVVGNGMAAVEDAFTGVEFLESALEKLKGSRQYAQQELKGLKSLIDQAHALSGLEPSSVEMMMALSNLEQARQSIEDYTARITFSIDKLEKLIAVVQLRVDSEINASGQFIRSAVNNYAEYSRRL